MGRVYLKEASEVKLYYLAIIICEHRNCTSMALHRMPVELHTAASFADAAAAYFRLGGWRCGKPGNKPHNLCPEHNSEN